MPLKRRRSPAEKKALSYAKDRRPINLGAGSDKAKRKARPLGKAMDKRRVRRSHSQSLSQLEKMNETDANLLENAISNGIGFGNAPSKWGESLADHIERQADRAERRTGRKQWSKKMRAKAKEQGASGYMASWRGSEVSSFFKPL
ncbi:MAG: hypothetical protein AAFR64_07690 [Pseudomonadota bacterium]